MSKSISTPGKTPGKHRTSPEKIKEPGQDGVKDPHVSESNIELVG